PGKRPHPQSAYLKALLLKREEAMSTCTQLRRYLLEHPLLVLVLGFRPVLNRDLPYGFDVAKTVPTARWLRQQQHDLSQCVLQDLLAATVRDLREEIPGLGEVVVLGETTLPFNENDITHLVPLYLRTVAALGFFPTHITADAAFDAWYVYELVAHRGGIGAIALNQHGHPESRRDRDGVPLCAKG